MLNTEPLNAEDVAELLHIGKNSVYKLAQTGELASYRIGRKLRFSARDVEAYLAKSRQRTPESLFNKTANEPAAPAPFVIAGNDLAGDVFANYLNAAGVSTTRTYMGSYSALVAVYCQQADAALVHLYDRKTNTYNTPYVQRIVPGMSVVLVRLHKRQQGFLVAQGNPKNLGTWSSLLSEGVRLANRERGCGTRVLLDEKLLSLEAAPEQITGYENEFTSALAMAEHISQGAADVGIGTQRAATFAPRLDFLPVQAEWIDLVVAKNERTRTLVGTIKQLAANPSFQKEFSLMEGCDASNMGAIVYEC